MADDRVYLRCLVCGQTQTLFKYLGCEAWLPDHLVETISAFANAHIGAGGDCGGMGYDLEGNPGFDLVCESTEGFALMRAEVAPKEPEGV